MKRNEINIEYTWDFSELFSSVLAWEKSYALATRLIGEFGKYKGKLGDSDILLGLLEKLDDADTAVGRLYMYAKMNVDLDGSNSQSVALHSRAVSLYSALKAAVSFVEPELVLLPEDELDKRIFDPAFSDYDYFLKRIKQNKKHVLSTKEETLIARYSEVLGGFSDIFSKIDNVDLPKQKISDGNERMVLTHGNYARLLQSKNRSVRRKAFVMYYKAYEDRINTIAACYSNSVKCDNISASVRNYPSALEASLESDDVPGIVYERLLASVDATLPALHEYVELRRKLLGELHMYDMYVPLFSCESTGEKYEDAFDTVLDALLPLGGEYCDTLCVARDARWIDVFETENKRSGAYSWGAYGIHPFVLLNYSGTTHDLFTIAHELGHAMHSFYSDKAQPQAKADYSIFVAEVASTVNEVLTCKYLIKKETDREKKKYLLSYYLDMIRTTFFRQAMFAEFESQTHALEQKGEALTVESMNRLYLRLNKKYYGNAVIHDKQIKCEWARIPHFYNAFYVYKYATGITSAITLAAGILSGGAAAVARYKKFLSAGGGKSPYEILRDAGVDLASDEPYKTAKHEFEQTLDELLSLI